MEGFATSLCGTTSFDTFVRCHA